MTSPIVPILKNKKVRHALKDLFSSVIEETEDNFYAYIMNGIMYPETRNVQMGFEYFDDERQENTYKGKYKNKLHLYIQLNADERGSYEYASALFIPLEFVIDRRPVCYHDIDFTVREYTEFAEGFTQLAQECMKFVDDLKKQKNEDQESNS